MSLRDDVLALPNNSGNVGEIPTGFKVPNDYEQLAIKLSGIEINNFIEVIEPRLLQSSYKEWIELSKDYWFWQPSEKINQSTAKQYAPIIHCGNGDWILYSQNEASAWVVLPRDTELIYELSGDVLDMLDWILFSGEYFESDSSLEFNRLKDGL